jgi:hypothetical protein
VAERGSHCRACIIRNLWNEVLGTCPFRFKLFFMQSFYVNESKSNTTGWSKSHAINSWRIFCLSKNKFHWNQKTKTMLSQIKCWKFPSRSAVHAFTPFFMFDATRWRVLLRLTASLSGVSTWSCWTWALFFIHRVCRGGGEGDHAIYQGYLNVRVANTQRHRISLHWRRSILF